MTFLIKKYFYLSLFMKMIYGLAPPGFENDDLNADCRPENSNCISCNGVVSLQSYRTFDGTCNHLETGNKHIGATNTKLRRMLPAEYDVDYDNYPRGFLHGFQTTNLFRLPPANEISQALFSVQNDKKSNARDVTVLFMTWGQFIDHDITLTHHSSSDICGTTCDPTSNVDLHYPCFPIVLQTGQNGCRKFVRSIAACSSSTNETREQINTISSYIDASMIYGSNNVLSQQLRDQNNPYGLMSVQSTSVGDLLPLNTNSNEQCHDRTGKCFLAGDVRVNENVALATMHTLWVRKHNQIANELKLMNPHWKDTRLYQETRRIIIALIQHLTFSEFLPLIYPKQSYTGYDSNIDPTISNGFATAAYRFGHSLVPNFFGQIEPVYLDNARPDLSLQEAFFNNRPIVENGIEETLLGLVTSKAENVDTSFSDAIKNKLFIPLGQNLQEDLTTLNIQRGRDHGIPPYVKWRAFCGLSHVASFEDLALIPGFENKSNAFRIYMGVEDIDLFVGGLTEKPEPGFMVGPTFQCIIRKQFENLRKGDRYWYTNPVVFRRDQLDAINKVTMKQIFCDLIPELNQAGRGLQNEVFEAIDPISNPRTDCDVLDPSEHTSTKLNLSPWAEVP